MSGKTSHKDVKNTGNWLLKVYYEYRPFMAFCCVLVRYVQLFTYTLQYAQTLNLWKINIIVIISELNNMSALSKSSNLLRNPVYFILTHNSSISPNLQVLYIILFLFADEKSTSLLSVRYHHFDSSLLN